MNRKRLSYIAAGSTAAYAVIMAYLLFIHGRLGYSGTFSEYTEEHLKLIPFETIVFYTRRLIQGKTSPWVALSNLLGNIVLFIPLGVILPFYIQTVRKWYKTAVLTAAIIFVVETVQLLMMLGTFDVDDIILNTLGAVIGYALFTSVRKVIEME